MKILRRYKLSLGILFSENAPSVPDTTAEQWRWRTTKTTGKVLPFSLKRLSTKTRRQERKVRFHPYLKLTFTAEEDLLGLTGKPGFAVVLLAMMQDNSIHVARRMSAGLYFKNYVRKHWDSTV